MAGRFGQPHVHILTAWQAQDKGSYVFFQQKTAPRGLSQGLLGSQDISESFLGSERRHCSSWWPPERGGPEVEEGDSLKGNKEEMDAEWAKLPANHYVPMTLEGPGVDKPAH